MSISLKQKLKNFFKAEQSSDSAVELLQNFIIPFSKRLGGRLGVDDMMGLFFGIDDRMFAYVKARRNFTLPGKYFVAGNRPIYGLGPRAIKKDQRMLLVLDRNESTARCEAVFDGVPHNYLLEKFELEVMKDWVDVIE